MNESDFISRWEGEQQIYNAWGHFVTNQVCVKLEHAIGGRKVSYFLKVPPTPRVKEKASLIDKAFHRNKNYNNPYEDITDKVGVRFVVLLSTEVRTVEKVITSETSWDVSRDRDFELERRQRPDVFSYQSVHFIVRPQNEIIIGNISVPGNTPCEVQIRTLLQHAHSELTHDTIYKPTAIATSDAERYCARSMALIEATDDYFVRVFEEIQKASKPLDIAMQVLADSYTKFLGIPPDPGNSNSIILDAYKEMLPEDLPSALSGMLADKPFIIKQITARAESAHLFRQPAILLMYLLVIRAEAQAIEAWPLTVNELKPVLSDLGL